MTTKEVLGKFLEAQCAMKEVSVYCSRAVDGDMREKIMNAKFHIAESKSAIESDRDKFNSNLKIAIGIVEKIADRSSGIPDTAFDDIDNCLSILREIGAQEEKTNDLKRFA